jgi:hypothetical protein
MDSDYPQWGSSQFSPVSPGKWQNSALKLGYDNFLLDQGSANVFGITPKYICVQRYYPLDLKVRKNELIAFQIVAYAMIISLAY